MCFHHQDPIYKTPMSSRHFHQQKKEATVPTSPCPTDMSFPLLWGESFQFDTCLQAGSGYRWGVAKTSSGSVGVAVTSNEVWSLVKKRKKIQKIPEKSILVGRCRCMTCFFFCLWSFFWVPMFFFRSGTTGSRGFSPLPLRRWDFQREISIQDDKTYSNCWLLQRHMIWAYGPCKSPVMYSLSLIWGLSLWSFGAAQSRLPDGILIPT